MAILPETKAVIHVWIPGVGAQEQMKKVVRIYDLDTTLRTVLENLPADTDEIKLEFANE